MCDLHDRIRAELLSELEALLGSPVTLATSFEQDLGLDFAEAVELVCALEIALGVDIPVWASENVETVEDVAWFVECQRRRDIGTVFFYLPREDPYGCFCNFSPHGVDLGGVWWPTVEHYYQAMKYSDTPYTKLIEQIRRAARPRDAKRLGRCEPAREDWDEVRVDVMRRALGRKFELHQGPRELLLATGDKLIVERAPGDYFWGCGHDGTGQNWLGRVLMEVRATLAAKR